MLTLILLDNPSSPLPRFSTCNQADFDTQISIFNGDCPNGLECIANRDDSYGCRVTTKLGTNLPGDDTYFILVSGYLRDVGIFNMSMTTGDCETTLSPSSYYPTPAWPTPSPISYPPFSVFPTVNPYVDCEGAEEIPFECDGPPLVFSGDTSLAPSWDPIYSDCGFIDFPGIWYKLIVPDYTVVPVR